MDGQLNRQPGIVFLSALGVDPVAVKAGCLALDTACVGGRNAAVDTRDHRRTAFDKNIKSECFSSMPCDPKELREVVCFGKVRAKFSLTFQTFNSDDAEM